MFRDLWNIITKVALIIGVASGIFIALELLRGFAFFHRFSPLAAWIYAGLIVGGALWALLYFFVLLAAYPRVLEAPTLPAPELANHLEMRRYCTYLVRYLERLARNRNLESAPADQATAQASEIRSMLKAHPLNEDLRRAIEKTDQDIIRPTLDRLEEQANAEVRRSVRDVMLAVTLSPYHSVDLVVVIYRNAAMVLRIAGLYCSRPNTAEQLKILRDVLRVVATVNFLYIGRNLLENLFANMPLIGRVVDDIGQGLGAGLFTSAAGHAAVERCAAYRGWSRRAAEESLASQTRAFLTDVRDIFTRDVLPKLRGRLRFELPEENLDQPGFWDKLVGSINTAVDTTANMMNHLVIKPAVAGTRGVMRAGSALTRGAVAAGTSLVNPSRRRRHRSHHQSESGLLRALGTFAQRVRYTWKGPPKS